MLQLGISKPWPKAMRTLTGEDKADAAPLLEYYRPLLDWLKQQNKGQKPGWNVSADPLKTRP